MLSLRKDILSLEAKYREKITHVCVGSYWVETVCSVLL